MLGKRIHLRSNASATPWPSTLDRWYLCQPLCIVILQLCGVDRVTACGSTRNTDQADGESIWIGAIRVCKKQWIMYGRQTVCYGKVVVVGGNCLIRAAGLDQFVREWWYLFARTNMNNNNNDNHFIVRISLRKYLKLGAPVSQRTLSHELSNRFSAQVQPHHICCHVFLFLKNHHVGMFGWIVN